MAIRSLTRSEWYRLCDSYKGEEVKADTSATVRESFASVEFDHGALSSVDLYVGKGATDIRIGGVQLLVGRGRAALVIQRGSFPISQWDVLWEGDFALPLDTQP
jgi:hypothetical protein